MRVFVKVDSISNPKIASITKLSLLNPGPAQVVIFDSTTKKYAAIKDVKINPNEYVLTRLNSIFGDGNVVLK